MQKHPTLFLIGCAIVMAIGVFPNSGAQCCAPPTSGAEMDGVLVLDNAATDFPVPGTPNLRK
jgi:hypothetical protein